MKQSDIDKLAAAISDKLVLFYKEFLTVEELCRYTGLKKSYIYKLTMNRAIPHYKPTGKTCYFKRTEVDAWMTENRVATSEELDDRALAYCRRNPLKINRI